MVDLPQPEGPRSATTSPGRTATSTSSSTVRGVPSGMVKSWRTRRSSQSAGVGGGESGAAWVVMAHLSSEKRRSARR